MKRTFTKAFSQLQALGCPVFKRDDHDGFFISAEQDDSWKWADYYTARADWQYENTNPLVDQVLYQHGLFAEWQNPACLIVHIA
jgi:hypothetical protein